jgi:hypothetical protein
MSTFSEIYGSGQVVYGLYFILDWRPLGFQRSGVASDEHVKENARMVPAEDVSLNRLNRGTSP